jgi:hypothetical protein
MYLHRKERKLLAFVSGKLWYDFDEEEVVYPESDRGRSKE